MLMFSSIFLRLLTSPFRLISISSVLLILILCCFQFGETKTMCKNVLKMMCATWKKRRKWFSWIDDELFLCILFCFSSLFCHIRLLCSFFFSGGLSFSRSLLSLYRLFSFCASWKMYLFRWNCTWKMFNWKMDIANLTRHSHKWFFIASNYNGCAMPFQ